MIATNHDRFFDFEITDDPDEADHNFHYSGELQDLLSKTYQQVRKKKPHLIPHLQKLIAKYPKVPAFKNYLMLCYQLAGKLNKAYEINRRVVQEHPDYTFGKINLALEHVEKKEFEEALDILGADLDLKQLVPGRRVFHVSEFRAFLNVVCRYLIETGQLEAAEQRLEEAGEMLGEEDEAMNNWRLRILAKRVENFKGRQKEKDERLGDEEIGRSYDASIQTDEKPIFHHPEIEALYHHALDIDHAILRQILALHRETLLQDLETVVWDCVRRYEYFSEMDWNEEELNFQLLALFLLAELNATEKLPLLLDLLRQGEELLEYWFADHIFETLWHLVYRLGNKQLDVLEAFMLEPDIHWHSKAIISQAVSQIPLHQPERRQEVLDWYKDVLTYFLEHLDDKHLIDIETISPMLTDLLDFRATELLPLAKRFFEEDLMDLMYAGDYEAFTKEILLPPDGHDVHAIFENSFDHLRHINDTWGSYRPEEKNKEMAEPSGKKWEDKFPASPKSAPASLSAEAASKVPKVGRNEPCPCGSGRKYKHCHGKEK